MRTPRTKWTTRTTKGGVQRALWGLATVAGLAVATSAGAAETWPPSTAPRVDLKPEVAPPVSAPAPPVGPPASPPVAPSSSETEPVEPVEPVTEERPATAGPSSETTIVRAAAAEPAPDGQLYGSRDGQAFLRTRRGELVVLPSFQLNLDALSLSTKDPYASENTVWVSRSRLEVAAWVYSKVYFDVGADFAPSLSLRHVDNFVAVAPWGERAILEVGQFDAPFTLANRTSERYLDFLDRGAAIRAFAIPENKDQGVMVHGTNPARNYYYSGAVLNGEGPGVTGASGHADLMARAWVAPFSFRDPDLLSDVHIGGSVWTGNRSGGVIAPQTTQGGFAFSDASTWLMSGQTSQLAMREQGRFEAVALELEVPLAHRFGGRFEWIGKRQPLAVFDEATTRPQVVSNLRLTGFGTYAEVWAWVLGDDRILGQPATPGLELPVRLADFSPSTSAPHGGLMVAARVDYIDETVAMTSDATTGGLGVAALGTTKLTAFTAGASYWYTRRARLMAEYTFNHFGGVTPYVQGLEGPNVHEVTLRMALAL